MDAGPGQRGEYSVTVAVNDQHGGVYKQNFVLEVATTSTVAKPKPTVLRTAR